MKPDEMARPEMNHTFEELTDAMDALVGLDDVEGVPAAMVGLDEARRRCEPKRSLSDDEY